MTNESLGTEARQCQLLLSAHQRLLGLAHRLRRHVGAEAGMLPFLGSDEAPGHQQGQDEHPHQP